MSQDHWTSGSSRATWELVRKASSLTSGVGPGVWCEPAQGTQAHTPVGEPPEEATPCCSVSVHCGKGQLRLPVRGAGDPQSPLQMQQRAALVEPGASPACGRLTITPGRTWGPWVLFGGLATGGQCDHVQGGPAKASGRSSPQRRGGASARSQDTERGLVPSSGLRLGPVAPDILRSQRGSAGVYL